jgi:hypothetical protein
MPARRRSFLNADSNYAGPPAGSAGKLLHLAADTPIGASSNRIDARDRFTAALNATIDLKFAEIFRPKQSRESHLTYIDGQILVSTVRNVFTNALGVVPLEVEDACRQSEEVLSPAKQGKFMSLKAVVGLLGGAIGLGLVLVAGVRVFDPPWQARFTGTPWPENIVLFVLGLFILALSGYFATRRNSQVDSERFLRELKASVGVAVDSAWPQHGAALTKALDDREGQ